MQNEKTIDESRCEQVHILMPQHINGNQRLFGGRLMEWIDVVAAVVARRHCGTDVTTVYVDNLHFRSAAFINDTIVLKGEITYVGNSSMEVRVRTYIEYLDGRREKVNQAYLVMVSIDEEQRPKTVPRLRLETEEQKLEWEHGARRRELRRLRKEEHF